MTRPPSGVGEEKEQGVKKGPWTPDEDQKLVAYIQQHGHGSWRSLPLNAGLQRCGKSCRLRWTNYLRPDIKRGRFTQEEDGMIVHLHAILGSRWSAIAGHLPRRTDNEIKNYWNTHLKKRLLQMGIDPVTHKSTAPAEADDLDSILPALPRPVMSSTLSHISQWECTRAEADARLARKSTPTQTTFDAVDPKATHDVSTSFMSSWKAQVAETLRPSFGVVEIDKTSTNPVNLEKFLHDWESSHHAPKSSKLGFSASGASPIDFTSSSAASEVMSPQYITPATYTLPSSAQITERLRASRGGSIDKSSMFSGFEFPGKSNQFMDSPTSTLHCPDYDSSYTNSPCVSGNSGENVDFLAQSLNSFIQQQNNHSPSASHMIPSEPSFWSMTMADALQPSRSYNLVLSELTSQVGAHSPKGSFMLSQVGVPNNLPIPQIDYLH